MCGIFAYSGPRDVREVLIQGLKGLEYRGYDSAGVAFFEKGSRHVHRFRVCGGVDKLEKKVKSVPYNGFLGIGHTRWATHGIPSEKNAHPHRAHSIYVVHNGVIENEEEIKRIIDPKYFLSDTDTEMIPHLIHYFCKTKRLSFLQSVLKTINWIKGSYAVVAICEDHPEEIIAFKSGPPLIFCRGKQEFFISSDPYSAGKQAREVIFLEDGEILFLKKDQFQILILRGIEFLVSLENFLKIRLTVKKVIILILC